MPRPDCRRGFTRVDLSVGLLVLVASAALLVPACYDARVSDGGGAMSQSVNNLKQMCIGLCSIAVRIDGVLPPAVGAFPAGSDINGSIFFHILPDIELDAIYNKYAQGVPGRANVAAAATESVRTFCAPLDSSNPGSSAPIGLTSYASNGAVFGVNSANRTVRYPDSFQPKGASNTVAFMERYAVVGAERVHHTWRGIGNQENYLYLPVTRPDDMSVPEFGVAPTGASNHAPHAFHRTTLLVGMADGSSRRITEDVSRTFAYADGRTATIWAWACTIDGPLGKAETPNGW